MTYYALPRSRLSLAQIFITVLAIFCFFGWMQERDERAREVTELHQTLAALDAECTPVKETDYEDEYLSELHKAILAKQSAAMKETK